MVLDHFVFHHAHAGFGHGHPRQRDACVGGGQRGAAEDVVDLLLRELREGLLRLLDARHQGVEFDLIANGHSVSPETK